MFADAIADFSADTMLQNQEISSEEKEKQENYYLRFKSNDKILIQQKTDGGWWYGLVYTPDLDLSDQEQISKIKSGYFPETYVKQIVPKKPLGPPPKRELKENQNYKEYAQEIVQQEERKKLIHDIQYQAQTLLEAQKQVERQVENLEEEKILGEEEFRQMIEKKKHQQQEQQKQEQLKRTYQELGELYKKQEQEKIYQLDGQPNQFGIQGYKKIKLTGENYEGLKNNREVKIDEQAGIAYIPVKEQSQLARSYRQMNAFFDYDSWNDKMNQQQNKQKKGKPDPSRKKDKKNKTLEKLLNLQ